MYSTIVLCFSSGGHGALSTQQGKGGINGGGVALLVMLAFFALNINTVTSDTVVNRVNYGVIFTKETTVGVVYDYWTHTVKMNIPSIRVPSRVPIYCIHTVQGHENEHCLPLQKMYQSVEKIRAEFMQTLNDSLTNLMVMMPKSPKARSQSKSKRAPLSFIGDIGKSLFGTARVKDVKLLARHIEALETKAGTTLTKLAQFTEDMSSFISISDKRYDNLKTAVMENRGVTFKLSQEVNDLDKSLRQRNQLADTMMVLFIEELYHSINLQTGFSDFLDGIHDLMRHKLSPHIVPHQDLLRIIQNINSKLQAQDIPLEVLPMATPDMYNFYPFFWTYRNSGLYVTIKFPLVLSSMGTFDIYRIISFPVPMNNDSSNHATVLSNVPELLGFSHSNKYYGFPTRNMISGPILDAQTANLPLHPFLHQSCITGIFFDEKQTIKDLCDFRVTLNSIKPAVIHLHHGQYLVLNVTKMYQKCPSGLKRVSGCPFCVYSVPCFCDLATDEVYYPPRLTHCVKSNGSVPLEHSLNLAVLLHIFELDEIKHITAESKFAEQPLVPTPPLKLFKHNFSELIAQDKQDDLSLKRIADNLRQDKVVFQTLADPILDDLNDLDDDTSLLSWNSILTIANAAVLILIILGGCYLYYKVRILTATIAVLKQIPPASTQDLIGPNVKGMNIFSTTPAIQTPLPIYITIHDDTLMYVLIAFACALLCFIIYKLLTNKSSLASICVEISSGKSCILIPMITIPYCPKFFHVQIRDNFSDIKVDGYLQPTFSWHNGSLKITNLIDQSELNVPNQMSISIIQAIKLRILLRKTIYCYLVATHGCHAFHLKLCSMDCTDCSMPAPTNVTESPAINVQSLSLYPTLPAPASEKEETSP